MSGAPLLIDQHERVRSLSHRLEAAPSRGTVLLRVFGLTWLVTFFPAFWFYHGLVDGSRWSDVVIRDAQNEAITYHPWGWQSIYLTNWGGVTQLFFWLTALSCSGTDKGRRHADRYFTLAWPLGVFIGVMFYATILPGIIGAVSHHQCGHEYPATVNNTHVCGPNGNATCAKAACEEVLIGAGLFGFCQHGVPMLLIIVEGCITPHEYGKWAVELVVVFLYAFAYVVWNQVCFWKNKCWPYPFQELLQAPAIHATYVTVLLVFICALYFLGRRCNKKPKTGPDTSTMLMHDAEMTLPGESLSSEQLPSPSVGTPESANRDDGVSLFQQARVKVNGMRLRVGAGPFASVVAWAGDGLAPPGFDMRSRRPGQRLVEVAELRVGSLVQVVERCENVVGGNGRKRSNWLKVRTTDGIVGFLTEDSVVPMPIV